MSFFKLTSWHHLSPFIGNHSGVFNPRGSDPARLPSSKAPMSQEFRRNGPWLPRAGLLPGAGGLGAPHRKEEVLPSPPATRQVMRGSKVGWVGAMGYWLPMDPLSSVGMGGNGLTTARWECGPRTPELLTPKGSQESEAVCELFLNFLPRVFKRHVSSDKLIHSLQLRLRCLNSPTPEGSAK